MMLVLRKIQRKFLPEVAVLIKCYLTTLVKLSPNTLQDPLAVIRTAQ